MTMSTNYNALLYTLNDYNNLNLTLNDLNIIISLLSEDKQQTIKKCYNSNASRQERSKYTKKMDWIKKEILKYAKFINADITFIIGRSGSGKSTLENYLKDTFNWTSIDSYTTRPPRYGNEPGHIYITMEEATTNPNYSKENRIAETVINNNLYFATKNQFNNSNIYVIDPKGFKQIIEENPELNCNLIYLNVPKKQIEQQLKKRQSISNETSDLQNIRLQSESKQFDDFEIELKSKNLPNSVNIVNPKILFKNFFKNI